MRSTAFVVALLTAVPAFARGDSSARNVILFIGDGLGASQLALGLQYARMVEGRELALEQLMGAGRTGYALPIAYGSPVTDSAAAASQIATGNKARNESFGVSADGFPVQTIVEWAHARGLKTGLVSNMRLSHATVAAFAAHQISRYNPEADILDDVLADDDVDVLLGGGARALVPRGHSVSEFLPGVVKELDGESNREDDRNHVVEAIERGDVVVSDRDGLAAVPQEATRLLGLFAASHLPYVVDTRAKGLTSVPSLRELTSAALQVLSRSDAGFFLMVEGGRIDYAGHDNDAGTMLHEILDFDAAVKVGIDFQEQNPETLVIATADHGTGGFSFTYGKLEHAPESVELASGLEYHVDHHYPERAHLLRLKNQSASYDHILEEANGSPDRLVEAVFRYTGLRLTVEEANETLARDGDGLAWTHDFRNFYSDPDDNQSCLLGRALAPQTFVVWSTGGHTMAPVLTFGRGPGSKRLRGVYENTHLYTVMREALAH